MRNNKKSIKLAVLLFAMVFTVGAAFAATNGVLTFGGTVRIRGMEPEPVLMRVEFTHVDAHSHHDWHVGEIWAYIFDNTVNTGMGHYNALRYNIDIHEPALFLQGWNFPPIYFEFENTGTVPVRLLDVTGWHSGVQISLQNPNTGSHFMIWETPWQNEVLQPGEVIIGWIEVCREHVYEAYYHNWDEWTVFESHLELHYEMWR